MKTTFIYALRDPKTEHFKYLGKANNPTVRFKEHCKTAKAGGNTYRDKWIRSLFKAGLFPKLEIIDEVPLREWEFWEVEYIKLFTALGFPLTNLTTGGDGITLLTDKEKKMRGRLSGEARKGKPQSAVSNERRSLALRGRKLTESHIANMRLGLRGNKNALGKQNSLGRKDSEATREKKRAAQRQRWKQKRESGAYEGKRARDIRINKDSIMCTKCKILKETVCFSPSLTSTDGYRSSCKKCCAEAAARYRVLKRKIV